MQLSNLKDTETGLETTDHLTKDLELCLINAFEST